MNIATFKLRGQSFELDIPSRFLSVIPSVQCQSSETLYVLTPPEVRTEGVSEINVHSVARGNILLALSY